MFHLFYTSFYEMRGEEVYIERETLDEIKDYIAKNPSDFEHQFQRAVLIEGNRIDLKELKSDCTKS